MDEMAKVISQKTGLTPEQSKAAGQAAVDYIMTKLPAPLAEQVKNAMAGGGGAAGSVGDALKGFGFGKK